eukprot:g9342.t1
MGDPTAVTDAVHTTPAEALVDEIFGALSNTKNDTNNGSSNGTGTSSGSGSGSNVEPAEVEGGGSNTRAALKELILAVQDKLQEKLAPPPARQAQGVSSLSAGILQGRQQDSCVFLKRARTRKEVRCCVEPKFGSESFVFVLRKAHELPVTAGGWAAFLQTDLPLHVALTKHEVCRSTIPHGRQARPGVEGGHDEEEPHEHEGGWDVDEMPASGVGLSRSRGELVGTAEVDWRRALVPASGAQDGLHKSGGVVLAVELASAAPDSIVHPVGGILHLQLEVVAPPEVPSFPFKAGDVKRVMDLQVSVRSEARRDFYLYANAWWKGFTSTSKDLSKRFVSLLSFQPRASVGEQRALTWNSPHAFLAAGTGDASDHALLLCSLLLGFGLDAFVCCGLARPDASSATSHQDEDSTERGEEMGHMWVCTFSGPRADNKAVFWESLTGQRFTMHAPQPRLQQGRRTAHKLPASPQHLSKISCMFNHHEFFANKQADNRVRHTSLNISDPKLWKPMDSSRILAPGLSYHPASAGPAGVVLLRPALNTETTAECVELDLKRRVTAWREGKGWSTTWDDDLGYLLGPAVFAYEQERLCGSGFGGDDFQDAVQGAVPDRHCFKGYPTCFDHVVCGEMMASLLGRKVAHDILSCTGDHLRFALRSTVFPYPNGVLAVWLMLACRFEASTG